MTDTVVPTAAGWRASSLTHLPVVEVGDGHIIGEVADLVFDPGTATVAGILVAARGRHESPVELARRVFSGSTGLTYVDTGHVVSLNSDVVTIDFAEKQAAQPLGPLPRLSKVMRFEVISIRGKRLGHLADLLLDGDGRHVAGYLVAPPTSPSDTAAKAAGQFAADTFGELPEMAGAQPQPALAPSLAPTNPPLLVIASDEGVRVGRDLIIVAGRGEDGAANPQRSAAERAPFMANGSGYHVGTSAPPPTAPAPDRLVYDPDAPTEQIRG